MLCDATLHFQTAFSSHNLRAQLQRDQSRRKRTIAPQRRSQSAAAARPARREDGLLCALPPVLLLHIRNTIPEDKIALPSPPWVHLEPLMLCYYSAGWSSLSQSPGARRRLPVLAQPLLGSSFAALTAGSPLPKPRKRHTPLSLHQDPETARAQDHEHKEGGREQESCS